ncbi:MAG: hypothetical protein A4E65_03051 [Syntrophorhabdus sp. PtaU1.Bin153]|nr:MAG: hypothetical protein A4E65_03051 [Syntrophorhabdus sp. PtaU1.Bin153]
MCPFKGSLSLVVRASKLLNSRNFIFLMSLVAGLVWDTGARYAEGLMLPGLALIMTLSTMNVSVESFRSPRVLLTFSLAGIAASYFVQASVILALNTFLIKNQHFWEGFVLVAAVPPAVAVIPFALFLDGDKEFALLGTIGTYLAGLFLTPLIALVYLGTGFLNPLKLLAVLVELIIAPLVLAKILVATGVSKRIDPWKEPVMNWTFFLVIYILTGLNRDVFMTQPGSIVPVLVIAIANTFVLGWLIEKAGIFFGFNKARVTSFLLLSTYKNYGIAGGLALIFFDPKTAVPATVTSAVGILYFIWLSFMKSKGKT